MPFIYKPFPTKKKVYILVHCILSKLNNINFRSMNIQLIIFICFICICATAMLWISDFIVSVIWIISRLYFKPLYIHVWPKTRNYIDLGNQIQNLHFRKTGERNFFLFRMKETIFRQTYL